MPIAHRSMPVALAGLAFAAVAGFVHWVVAGPNEVEPKDEEAGEQVLNHKSDKTAGAMKRETRI
jgi:hypothetical protein